MSGMFYMLGEMIAPIFLMPVITIFYGRRKSYANGRILCCMMFTIYLAAVFHLTGQPDLLYHRFDPNINLQISWGIITDFRNGILNILLFVPLGFFLPTLDKRYRHLFRAIVFGLCMTVLIELLQMFTLRATDINDIITNTVGTGLGWSVWYMTHKLIHWPETKDRVKDILFCCASTYFVMFFIQPFGYTLLWHIVMQ